MMEVEVECAFIESFSLDVSLLLEALSEKSEKYLRKYRTRYVSLNSQISKTKPGSKFKSKEMFEYYKKEGKIMKQKYEND